jgi:UDP-N-acetylglucosamine diphosphorylase / glucose-1-phosphate thymidylyltransferase / UDP-N-acetylgalactosamine diphosphorylase / glucosamine-1-phosphate N-acetyltransferase / galactosamine-1-phosphate N-acetyltransferase
VTIVVFEDQQCEELAPITLARIAATVTCASFRLIDFLDSICESTGSSMYGIVRPHLQAIQRIDYPTLRTLDHGASATNGASHDQKLRLLLNGRIAPTSAAYQAIESLLRQDSHNRDAQPRVVLDRDFVAAVINPPWSLHDLYGMGYLGAEEWLSKAKTFTPVDLSLPTIAHPHELIATNMSCFRGNMELRLKTPALNRGISMTQTTDGLFVAKDAFVGDYVLADTKNGPILIDQGAEIGPYTLLRGPLYIGPKSRILEHSAIKDAVSLSHTTKIGGEVEASVVEPYTNKQHHGFLGHSYLGSWINLGAGTCNSDLKNTYGTVNMEYASGKCQTNMQFLGCIMGDYSKTAINTGIFTGKVIGVCSMMYGFVTSNVPSFVNYARLFGQMATLPPEVMVSTQQRMFARRKVQQRGCDLQLIYDMHRLTQMERDRHGEALAL